jgi:germination protein M
MKRLLYILILCLLISLFSACGRQPDIDLEETAKPDLKANKKNLDSIGNNPELNDPTLYLNREGQPHMTQVTANLYFCDEKNNRLVPETRQVIKWNENNVTTGILNEFIKGPKDSGLKPVVSPDTRVIKIEQIENIMSVNLTREFLDSDNLMIARAALVNTLTSLEGLKYIKIYVEGRELTFNGKDDGTVLGLLTRYPNNITDIEKEEAQYLEDNAVRRVNRELFFPDANGIYLLSEVRTVAITNGSLVQSIVEELIKGPANPDSGLYPALPKGTKLNSLLVVDGQGEGEDRITLYFSKEFKSQFLWQYPAHW